MIKRRAIALMLALCLLLPSAMTAEELHMDELIEEVLLEDDEPMEDETEAEADTDAELPPEKEIFTPAHGSPYEGQDTTLNYWTLPMDITNEEAIWEVLTQKVTVLDGKSYAKPDRVQITLRKEKDLESEGVGVCTCETQAVHVLERGPEWSLIECYSSSFHDSKILNWNVLVQGYVQTKYLKEITPNQEMGMVIDKLTQRLYIFREGKLFTTLLVSTGVSNAKQPYNETRSGSFLLNSRVGDFKSDNMTCRRAIRFNSGDLLHEVPYIYSRNDAGYKKFEAVLGSRASHGCIRVQRKKTPEGVNLDWIYEHFKKNMTLLLWEDWQGRQIDYPADDTVVYYNPNKGTMYHSAEKCYSAIKKTLEPFTYGELDTGAFAKLTRCPYCTPPLRKAEIDAINEEHAPGGDHDPILTEARKSCPKPLRGK